MAKCCACLFKPKPYTIIFFIYILLCFGKYMLVGFWTADLNYHNAKNMNEYKMYACDCYYVSKQPGNHGIAGNVRFDFAQAIPQCTDCKTCQSFFHGSAEEAFNATSRCPADPDYVDKYGSFDIRTFAHWRHATGCNSKFSMTTMVFWTKNYNDYAKFAWSISGTYGAFLIISIITVGIFYKTKENKIKKFKTTNDQKRIFQENKGFINKMDYVMKVVYLYNILVSVGLLYLFYKPIQYYRKDLYVGARRKHIICEVNSMPKEQENILGICAIMTVGACLTQLLYTIFYSCKCCRKCCKIGWCVCYDINLGNFCKCDKTNKSWKCCGCHCSKYGGYGRKESLSDSTAELIHKYGSISPKCVCCPHRQCSKYLKLRSLFGLIMVVFLGFTMAAYGYIYKGVTKIEVEKYQRRVIATLILLPLSFIDNPWSWKAIIEFCGQCMAERGRKDNISINIFDEETETVSDDGRY